MSKRAMSAKSAEKAGVNYAKEQVGSEHFRDWVWDQMSEADQMRRRDPNSVIPSDTPDSARKVARNMLQQLEWDTKRELDPREILGQDPSKENEKAFWAGFEKELAAPTNLTWLTDLVLEFDGDLQRPHGATLHEARRTQSTAFDTMGPTQFRDALQAELQSAVGDRQPHVKLSKSWGPGKEHSIYVNYINLPSGVGGAGGGAEAENNRMSFWIHGFGAEDAPPPSGKLSIEMSNSALPREYALRKKTAKPSAIAGYLAEFLGKVAREVEPKFTHTARYRRQGDTEISRDKIQSALALVHHNGRSPEAVRDAILNTGLNDGEIDILLNAVHVKRSELGPLTSQVPHKPMREASRGGIYEPGDKVIVNAPGSPWHGKAGTVKALEKRHSGSTRYVVEVDGREIYVSVGSLRHADGGGGMRESAAMREMRAGSIPPVDDPDYIIQGAYSDGKISEEFGYDDEKYAVEQAKKLLKSPYFEGEHVRVITRDGELVWDSRSEQRRRSAEPRRGARPVRHVRHR